MQFYEPILAKCDDRNSLAKVNPIIGEPHDHINAILSEFDLVGVSFDFFINWNTFQLNREIWLKMPFTGDILSEESLINLLRESKLLNVAKFARANDLSIFAVIFNDEQQWSDPNTLVTVAYWPANDREKFGLKIHSLPIQKVQNRIKELSGGPVRIGNKGLMYGTSKLECYLSRTDALWPGDVDLLICDKNNFIPKVLIEYKKHTGSSSISFDRQCLDNYYPNPDKRKYDRLLYLSNQLIKETIPIFVIYYSTNQNELYFLVEKIRSDQTNIYSEEIFKIDFDENNSSAAYYNLIDTILNNLT